MKLIQYLPDDYRNSPAAVELQESIEKETVRLEAGVDDLTDQLFLDTATWGLKYWEKVYGIETDLTKGYDIRRSRVRAKMRGTGTTTVEMVKNTAESYVNGEVDVVEYNSEYRFEVIMLSVIGIPPNMDDLIQTIEEIKPAHLAYTIVIRYNTWDMVKEKGLTWLDAAERTWKGMMEVAL